MDLSKVAFNVSGITKDQKEKLMQAVRQLPPDTISGNNCRIIASQNSESSVILSLGYRTKEEDLSIVFNIPSEARNVTPLGHEVHFDYNDSNYILRRYARNNSPK